MSTGSTNLYPDEEQQRETTQGQVNYSQSNYSKCCAASGIVPSAAIVGIIKDPTADSLMISFVLASKDQLKCVYSKCTSSIWQAT